jgi:hypothetical protein
MSDVTRILGRVARGDSKAAEALLLLLQDRTNSWLL